MRSFFFISTLGSLASGFAMPNFPVKGHEWIPAGPQDSEFLEASITSYIYWKLTERLQVDLLAPASMSLLTTATFHAMARTSICQLFKTPSQLHTTTPPTLLTTSLRKFKACSSQPRGTFPPSISGT